MSDTIDTLAIEISGDASSATRSLDSLTASLGRLKTALSGGAGLNTFSKRLVDLKSAVEPFKSTNMAGFRAFVDDLNGLNGLKDVKISSTIPKNIAAVVAAAGTIDNSMGEKIRTFTEALAPLNDLPKTNLNSTMTALKKIPDITKGLDVKTLDEFGEKVKEVTAILRPLATEMDKVAAGFSAFPAKIQRLIQGNYKYAKSNGMFNKGLLNTVLNLGALKMAFNAAKRVVGGWIENGKAYIEDLNLFSASMGQYAKEAQNYAEKVGELVGIDPSQWMRNQGVFQVMIKGFGAAGDRVAVMSKNLTQLGYDLGSFFNLDFDDAMQKLQSGMAGEQKPLRSLGYDLSAVKLEATAASLGIKKLYSSMTQAEKAELRYYAIMTQVTTAQGDMARTLNAPANQLRVFESQATQASRALGNIFIPALNTVLPYAIAFIKIIRWAAQELANLFGFSLPEVDYSGVTDGAGAVDDLADGLGNASNEADNLRNSLSGIDEINVIASQSGGSGGGSGSGSGGGGGFDFDLPQYDFLGDLVGTKTSALFEEWKKALEPIMSWVVENFEDVLYYAGLIGAALLGWKVGKSVADAFGLLNSWRLGAFAAGMVISIGLAWDAGSDFANGDILGGTIKSMLALAIGTIAGAILTGSLLTGFAIALPVVLIFGILGYFNELNQIRLDHGRAQLEAMYGAIDLTREKAAALAKQLRTTEFSAKVELALGKWDYVNEIDSQIKAAQDHVNETMIQLKTGIDDSPEAVENHLTAVSSLVTAVKERLKEASTASALTLDAFFGSDSEEYQAGVSTSVKISNAMQEKIDLLADNYASYIREAFSDQDFSLDEQKVATDLYLSLQEALNIAQGMEYRQQVLVSIANFKLSDLTYDSYSILREELNNLHNEQVEGFKSAVAQEQVQLEMEVSQAKYLYDTASPENKASYYQLWQDAQYNLNAFDFDMVLNTKISEAEISLSEDFFEAFKETWGAIGLEEKAAQAIGQMHIDPMVVASTDSLSVYLKDFSSAAEALVAENGGKDGAWYKSLMSSLDDSAVAAQNNRDILNKYREFGQLIPEEILEGENSYQLGLAISGDVAAQTYIAGKNAAGEPEFLKGLALIKDMGADLPQEFITGLSANINDITTGINGALLVTANGITTEFPVINQTLFDNFATMGIDLRNYVSELPPGIDTALADSFAAGTYDYSGSIEGVKTGVVDAVYDVEVAGVGAAEQASTSTSNALALDSAPLDASISEIETGVVTSIQAVETSGVNATTSMVDNIEDAGQITFASPDTSNLTSGLNTLLGVVGGFSGGFAGNISTVLDSLIALASSSIGATSSGDSLSFWGTVGSFAGTLFHSIGLFADGGFPTRGQLFIANEAGPEMVGSLGGRTAVANNDQIVDGIANGVAAANEKQNARIDEIIRIAKALLAKDNGVAIYPSAPLGKVVKRSEALYAKQSG